MLFHQRLKIAYIRLITKEGDPTVMKNWHPITIISTVDKLYCEVIHNRLESLVDHLLGQVTHSMSTERVRTSKIYMR